MNLFLRKIAVLFGVFIIAYPLIILSYTYFGNSFLDANVSNQLGAYGHLHSRIREADTTQNVDVLAIGSSLCYRGIDPRILEKEGISLFNLGSSGQSHIQTTILLEQYLDQFSPKVVIYECSPSMFSNDGVGSGLDLIYNSHLSSEHVKMAMEINNIKLYNALLNSGMQRLLGIYSNFSEKNIKGRDTYISGGYVEKELKYYTQNRKRDTTPAQFKPLDYQLKAFLANVELIKHSGSKLVLIQAPLTSAHYRPYLTADSLFYSLGHYINFNNNLELHDSLHFYDHTHLNQFGVTLFNEALINELKTL